MSQVFISYAREDRDLAQQLVTALERGGLRVWWDTEIPTGQTFSDVIDQAISKAACVIVLWSRNSVTSNWVLEEAAEARDRGILIPVLLEPVTIPRGFRRYQAADFSSWDGNAADPVLEKLISDVSLELGHPRSTEPPVSDSSRTPSPNKLWSRLEVRVLAIYGLAGLMVNQTASALLPSLSVPAWVVTALAWITFAGFPVALLIAWRWPHLKRARLTRKQGSK